MSHLYIHIFDSILNVYNSLFRSMSSAKLSSFPFLCFCYLLQIHAYSLSCLIPLPQTTCVWSTSCPYNPSRATCTLGVLVLVKTSCLFICMTSCNSYCSYWSIGKLYIRRMLSNGDTSLCTWHRLVLPFMRDKKWFLGHDAGLQVNRSSDRSFTWSTMHTKIHLIYPGCTRTSVALLCSVVTTRV